MNHSMIGKLRRHALTTAFAAMLIVAGGIGHALAEDDDDDELPDTKFFKNMLSGLGLKKDGDLKSGTTYQERPPLVVPPPRDLPPPQTTDAVRGNVAWPKDQDEQRRLADSDMRLAQNLLRLAELVVDRTQLSLELLRSLVAVLRGS